VSGVEPHLAGAAGSAAGSVLQQGIDDHHVSLAKTALDTSVGAVAAGVGEKLSMVKIPGITSGRHSMRAVFNQVASRVANGTAGSMGAKTFAKGLVAETVGGSLSRTAESATHAGLHAGAELVESGYEAGKQLAEGANQLLNPPPQPVRPPITFQ